jgi:hypothetical protein
LLAASAVVGLPLGSDLAGVPLLIAAGLGVMLQARMRSPMSLLAWAGMLIPMSACMLLSLHAAGGYVWLAWVVAAAVAAVLQRLLPPRSWFASGCAGLAFAAWAGAMASAGGAPSGWAILATTVLAFHLLLMVPLVRAQVRRGSHWSSVAIESHVAVLVIMVGLWASDLIPSVIPLLFGFGLARCVWYVDNRTSMSTSPARIGSRELAWLPVLAGGLTVALRGGWA